jgi:hypothetical protein
MDLRGLIKGVIMGIVDKSAKIKQRKEKETIQLSKQELEFLLKLIANSAFQGKDLQLIYDLTAKLQKQYSN